MTEIALSPIAPPDATVVLPGSRSFTNRALLCAALAEGTSTLVGWLDAEDTQAMMGGLTRLGVKVERQDANLVVHGVGGEFAIPLHPIDCGASGTTMRFLTAVAALVPGKVVLDGTTRMRERPIHDLADALSGLGVSVRTSAGCPPVTVHGGGLTGGEVMIDASRSSQFVSALLMAAPHAKGDVRITAAGGLVSRHYVEMTLETMSAFGVSVEIAGPDTFRIPAPQAYRPRTYAVEPDASTAMYFFAAAAVTGGRVRVDGLSAASTQADARFVEVLERMGCRADRGADWVAVRGPRYLHGIEVDLNAMPDSALTLAVVACQARGRTTIRNVPHLRYKETDRMKALERELAKLGAQVQTTESDLIIDPPERIQPARIATYDDHRIAMSFAVAGLVAEGIVIEDPDCVKKTFPDFFKTLGLLA